MPITIVRYSEDHIVAVRDFNRRLQEGGAPADYTFSESSVPAWLPRNHKAPVYNEFFLALDGAHVRGAFALKHQMFSFYGSLKPLVYLHHPFSEGIIDKRHAQVGAQMVMRIIREHPFLFALGMGGYDRPLPRMLVALHWKHCLIPFYFRVCNASKFLRELSPLRKNPIPRLLSTIAAVTGAVPIAMRSWQAFRGRQGMATPNTAEIISEFDDWADSIWNACAPDLAMSAVRNAETLRVLYPAQNRKLTRIRVTVAGQSIGWAVVGTLHRPGNEQYGDLRVGTILDVLARPQHATAVIAAATKVLTDQGADLIASNQSHAAWTDALARCGFFKGPSNFIFAAANSISGFLEPFETRIRHVHLNRGDGDNLLQYL
jgi:hypothetical protein